MRIEPARATEFLERAAVDQMSREMQERGYTVEREVRFGDRVADLIARRDDEVIFFEFKVPGQGKSEDWATKTAALRDLAQAAGASFRLVLVRPPRDRRVEIEGIEHALAEALRSNMPPALEGIAATENLDDVTDVEIASLVVHDDSIELSGEAAAIVSLYNGEGELVDTVTFPFTFEAVLDRDNRIVELRDVEVDTSPWYGDDEAA